MKVFSDELESRAQDILESAEYHSSYGGFYTITYGDREMNSDTPRGLKEKIMEVMEGG